MKKIFYFRTDEEEGNGMKKIIMTCVLSLCMLLSSAYMSVYAAETNSVSGDVELMANETVSGNNKYDHPVTYEPVTHWHFNPKAVKALNPTQAYSLKELSGKP